MFALLCRADTQVCPYILYFMHIILNGEQTAITSPTLLAMVKEKGFDPDSVIAEVNLQLIKKDDWEQTALAEGDTVELLSFVGGG